MSEIRTGILAVVFLMFTAGASGDGNVYLGLGFGGGDLDIDQSSFPGADFIINDISGDVLVGDITASYRFDNDWSVDLSFEAYNSFDILLINDVIDLNTVRVGGGYHFPSDGWLSAFAKGGLSYWDIDFKESIFLNPGPEGTTSRSGTNAYFQIGAEARIGSAFAMRIYYDVSNPDIGDTRALKFSIGGYF